MNKDLAEVMLITWGDWSKHFMSLGIPRENIIKRMMIEGSGASHSASVQAISMPDSVSLTELIVGEMEKPIRDAVISKYVYDMSERSGGSRYKCGRYKFAQRINNGVMFVAGWMAANHT